MLVKTFFTDSKISIISELSESYNKFSWIVSASSLSSDTLSSGALSSGALSSSALSSGALSSSALSSGALSSGALSSAVLSSGALSSDALSSGVLDSLSEFELFSSVINSNSLFILFIMSSFVSIYFSNNDLAEN